MAAPDAGASRIREEDLVARVRSGDEAAFEALYARYFQRVYRFLDKRMGNRADVEETTQEVFVTLFLSIHSFRGEAPFGAWVFGITRRTLAGRFKKRRHPTVPLGGAGGEGPEVAAPAGVGNPLAAYEFRERIGRMEEARREDLTPEQRRLFDLHHLRHYSIQEIARVMRKSEDSVKSNLYRARKLLLRR